MEEDKSSSQNTPETDETPPAPPQPDTVISPESPEASAEPPSPPIAESVPETDANPPLTTVPEEPGADYPPTIQQPKPKKSKKGLILLIVLLLVIAGAAYYWFMVRKDNRTTTNTTTAVVKKDVPLIRYGTFEGSMNHFAPQLDNDSTTQLMNKQIFEPLVDFREKTKLTPVLAASWTNPDANTWLFTLQPNVKFHNGDTLTAKDVVYSYNEIKKNTDFVDQVTPTIKSVEAVGDNQVKVTTNGVDPILLNHLSAMPIVDSKAAGKADPAFGTGPYTLKTGTTNDVNHIDLVAFDNYHGDRPYTRELQITVYNDPSKSTLDLEKEVIDDVKAGKLDMVGFVSDTTSTAAKALGYTIFPVDDNSIYYLVPNVNKKTSPLSNLKFRQAVASAIDTDALMKAIGRQGTSQSQLVQQFIPGFNPAITKTKYDVAAAKQLLKDSGYPTGTGFTLTVYVSAEDAGKEMVRQLALVGIPVKLDVQSDLAKLQDGVSNGTFDAFYFADGSIYNDASDVFANELQSANYSNPQVDTLLTQANSTLDQSKRLTTLQQISKVAMDDQAVVPLYSNVPKYITTKPYALTQDLLGADLGVLFYKVYLSQ